MAVAKTRYISEYVIDTARAVGPARELDKQLEGVLDRVSGPSGLKKSLLGLGAGFSLVKVKNELERSLDELIRFEDGLVGVSKTTNITGEDLEDLGERIEFLSRHDDGLGTTTDELFLIAEAAGQVGVQGSAGILRYTETLDKLQATTDIVGEEGARDLARLQNITGESAETVDRLGSVLVALGNKYAATERQILNHAGEVARATAVYEINSAEAAAMGTTLAALGVRAELSGSAVGRTLRTIEKAVQNGGSELETLASISGVSAEDMREAWINGPIEALQLFLQGLEEVRSDGGNVAEVLERMGLKGEEILKVIPVLAKENRLLAEAIALAADETRNATALNEEAAKAAAKLSTEQRRLQQDIAAARRDIAASLRGPYAEFLKILRDILKVTELIKLVDLKDRGILVGPDQATLDAIQEAADHWKAVAEAQKEVEISAEAMDAAGAKVVRQLKLEEAAAKKAADALADLPAIADQIKQVELATEIEDQAQAWHELLGAASPGLEVLKRLAEQQKVEAEAAKASREAKEREEEATRKAEAAQKRLTATLEKQASLRSRLLLLEADSRGVSAAVLEAHRQALAAWSAEAKKAGLATHEINRGVDLMTEAFARSRQENAEHFLRGYVNAARLAAATLDGEVAVAQERFVQDLEDLLRLLAAGEIDLVTFTEALRALNAEFASDREALRQDVLREIETRGEELLRIRKEVDALEKAGVINAKEAERLYRERTGIFEDWAGRLNEAAGLFRSMNSELGDMLGSLAAAGAQMAQLAQDGLTWQEGVTVGLTALEGFDLGQTGNTIRQYAQVGNSVLPGWGAVIGAFVGWAVDAMQQTEQTFLNGSTEANRASVQVVTYSGNLDSAVVETFEFVVDLMNDIAASIGGVFSSFETFSLLVRSNGDIRATVNGLEMVTDDLQEAINFLVTEMFKVAEISGISDVMKAALDNFAGSTVEELEQTLNSALAIENLSMDEFSIGLQNRLRELNQLLLTAATEFGTGVEDVLMARGGIVGTIQAAYDQIFGIEPDVEEQTRRQIELLQTRIEVERASLLAMAAQIEAMNAENQSRVTSAVVTYETATAIGISAEQTAQAVAAIAGAVAALDSLLENGFSTEAIEEAIARARRAGRRTGSSGSASSRGNRRQALRELEILEALAAGNDERVAALEREARLQELIASGLNNAEAARRLELEAMIDAAEAAESARAALENLEILEARVAGNDERAEALEREARILQLVASGLTEVQAARQLELEAILNAEDALRSLEILEAQAAGDDERVAALEREIRMQELVASGLSEAEAARQLELEAIIAAAEAAEAAEAALRDLAILEARAAGDDERVAALEREIRLLDLVARGLSDVQAERYLELEAEIAAGEAAAAAAEEFNELAASLSERAAGAIQGPTGLAGRAAAIIDSIVSLQDEILEALEGQEPQLDSDLPENVRLLLERLDELDVELERQLRALGEEALAEFGSQLLGLRLETRRTANDIRFLLDNLEELGVSAADVARAVREGVLPDLLAIGEAQAQRVGDEEALARLTERRQQLELLFERVRFESMVATLRLAGALDEEMQALVLEVRRLFLLPDAPSAPSGGPTTTPQEVDQLARLRDELTGIIEASERSQLGSARQQLESIFDTFARAGSLLKAVSASASDWTRTAQAMATELRSFWRGLVLDPAQDRLDALRQARQTPAQQFMAARQAFEGLDLGGLSDLDPDQVQEIFQVLDRFQEAGVAQFGEGFGQTVVGRQVEAALEQLVGLVPDDEDLLLQAIQHLEEQTAARLDDIRGSVGAEGPIVLALTETGVAAEIRQLAEQIDDAAIAGGLEALATALENGEIGLDDASLLLALDELRDQLDPGSPLELQISGLIDQLASGLELNDVIIVGLDALRDTLDVNSPLYAQMGMLIDSMVAGDLTSAELLAGLYALRDQLDPGSPLEAELAALIAELEAGLTFEEVTIAGLLDLQRALDSDSPLHTQLGALIDQMVTGDLTSLDLLAGLYSLRDQLDPGSPLESELEALINELEGGLTFEEVTIAGLLQLQQTLDEGSPLHSQLGALIDQLFAGEISGAETVLALDELRDQLDPGSPLETEISNLIREYREGLDINDLIVVGLDDLQDALEEGSPLHRQLGGLIEQLLAGEISTAETILALDDLRDQLDPGSPLEMEISNLIREYREGLDINDLVILGLDDLRDALDENSPLHQQLGGLIDQLLAGEMSAADTILALYGLRDELDEGSPLLQELDGLIAQLAAGVAVDTGNLGDTLLGLSELLGVEGNSAAELLQDIAEELLAGTLTIDDHDLLSRLQGVIAELGEDHPLHSVLASVWETLGGGSGGAPEPIASLLRGDQWGGVGHYTKETWRRLGVDGTIARQLTPSVFGGTGYYAKETFELLGDIGSDVAAIAEAVAPSGMRTDPGADLMHELWGERSPVIARLDQISTQLGQLSESANMRAGGI